MKTLLAVIALSVATVFSAQAQTTKSVPSKKEMKSVSPDQKQDVTTQARALTEKMTRDLELTTEQGKKVLEQNTQLYTEMADMKSKDMKGAEMEKARTTGMDKYDAAMKRILKDEQYKKFTSLKDSYMSMNKKSMPADKSMDKLDE